MPRRDLGSTWKSSLESKDVDPRFDRAKETAAAIHRREKGKELEKYRLTDREAQTKRERDRQRNW